MILRALGVLAVAVGVSASIAHGQEADLDGIAYEIGDPNAPIIVVEYADLACDACALFAIQTWPTIRRDFVDTGRVRWRFVLFELGFRNSDESARAGHCGAELGDFWRLHDALYAGQERWRAERRPAQEITAIAVEAGFDVDEFTRCYEDDPRKDRTDRANRAARKDRVRATPTFFIDGFRVQGALPPDVFAELLANAGGFSR